MPTKTLSSPWLDRFETPTTEHLLESIVEEYLPLTKVIRANLLELPEVTEQVQWQGLPWRWSLAYITPRCPKERALAYLIPNPESARIAVPLHETLFPKLMHPKGARCLRENLAQSSRVGEVVWSEWVLGSRVLVDELTKLISLKMELLDPKASKGAPKRPRKQAKK